MADKKRRPSKTSSIIGAFSDEELNALLEGKFSDSQEDPDKVSTDAVDAYLKAQAKKRNISSKKPKKNEKSSSSEEDAHLFAQLADLVAKTDTGTSSKDDEKGLRESHVKELMGLARDKVKSKDAATKGSLTEDELNALFAGAEVADPDENPSDLVEKYLKDLDYAEEISSASKIFLEEERGDRKNATMEQERKKRKKPASNTKPKSKPERGAKERRPRRKVNDEVKVNLPRHYHTHDFETDSFNLRRAIKEKSQLKGLKERVHLDYHFYKACDREAVEKFLEESGRDAVQAVTEGKRAEDGKPKKKPYKKGTQSEEDIEKQIKALGPKADKKVPDILPSTFDWVTWEKGKPRDLLGDDQSEEETKKMISKLDELILLSSDYQLTEELMGIEDDEASTLSRRKKKQGVVGSEERKLEAKISPKDGRHREEIMIDIRQKVLPGKPKIRPKARERSQRSEAEPSRYVAELNIPIRKRTPEPKARVGLEGIPKEWIKQRDKQTIIVDREKKYGETIVVTARQHSAKKPTEEEKIVEKMTVTVQTHKEHDLIRKPPAIKKEDISREKLREVIMEVEEKMAPKVEKEEQAETTEEKEKRKLPKEICPREVSPKERPLSVISSEVVSVPFEKREKFGPRRTKPEVPLSRPSIREQAKPVIELERLLRQGHIVMNELALLSKAKDLKQEILSIFSEEPDNKIEEELNSVEEMLHELSEELHEPLPP